VVYRLSLLSIIIIVAWEWLPFAFLILFTSLKSLDSEQKEAAAIDGANPIQMFFYIVIPHLQRAIGVVVMIETIFLLSIFAEIYTTTSGGPGHASENLAFLVYALGIQGLMSAPDPPAVFWQSFLRTSSLLPGQDAC